MRSGAAGSSTGGVFPSKGRYFPSFTLTCLDLAAPQERVWETSTSNFEGAFIFDLVLNRPCASVSSCAIGLDFTLLVVFLRSRVTVWPKSQRWGFADYTRPQIPTFLRFLTLFLFAWRVSVRGAGKTVAQTLISVSELGSE